MTQLPADCATAHPSDPLSGQGVGEASIPNRIYLHGAGLNAESWGPVKGTALNLPGHGGRARAPKATVESFAAAMNTDVPAGAALIGHSFGGMVAMALATLTKGVYRSRSSAGTRPLLPRSSHACRA